MKGMTITNSPDQFRALTKSEQDLANGRDTLRAEAQGLFALADRLDENFIAALDIIEKRANGRVIISGMGKSGHVAKKMAATFASTGTPSFFVHPAEASHGDLGMVTDNDTVIALSKSGESAELRDIVSYCKRFDIPLIAIVQNPHSSLARQADVALLLPDLPEACPNQQAPTTSTTLTMALGDALAVALMKRRGFSATDFRQFHPGGKLGGQLLAVASIMKTGDDLPLVDQNADMNKLQTIMSARNYGCAIATDAQGNLAGFVTDGDIRRHMNDGLQGKKVSDIMGSSPMTIASDALAAAALAAMNQSNITQLVVTENNKPVGLVRLHDILRAGAA
jgi:arabinose-5-phosphate isomerase